MAVVFELTDLDGSNGFVIGTAGGPPFGGVGDFGKLISTAGDFNGDGYSDIFIGGLTDTNNGPSDPLFVIYGTSDPFPAYFDFNTIDGSNGVAIFPNPDFSRVKTIDWAGDVNNDGYDDLVIGDPAADYVTNPPPGVAPGLAGYGFVVFGSSNPGASIQLGLGPFAGAQFMAWDQPNDYSSNGSIPGFADYVSGIGDWNNDGIDDFIIGGQYFERSPNDRQWKTYIVYGQANYGGGVDPLPLHDIRDYVVALRAPVGGEVSTLGPVSRAGDFNGDGIDDFALANGSNAFVVFGRNVVTSDEMRLDLLNSSTGVKLLSTTNIGIKSISLAGDVNGDGVDDLIVGAVDPDADNSFVGAAYVVFGSSNGLPVTINLQTLNGSNGFVIRGFEPDSWVGYDVSGGGDVNGDGFDDLVIAGNNTTSSGDKAAYVIFGAAGDFAPALELSSLAASIGVGLVINPVDTGFGRIRSASIIDDINGDDIDEIIVGAPRLAEAYVIFGDAGLGLPDPITGTLAADSLVGTDGRDFIQGLDGADLLQGGLQADTIDGGGGDDTVYAMTAADPGGSSVGDSLRGGAGDDRLIGSGGFDTLLGGAGGDTLEGGLSSDYILGGEDDDLLYSNTLAAPGGSTFGDTLNGGAGNDTLVGSAGGDTLNGGDGHDFASYAGSPGGVTINLATGAAAGSHGAGDLLVFVESVIGSSTDDILTGNASGNVLIGSAGDDTLRGQGANDSLFGGFGKDRAEGGSGDDFIRSGPDNDTLIGGDGNDTLGASNRTDLLRGEDGDDLLLGSNGNDRLFGGDGADTLLGGNGRDTLSGDAGADRLLGGAKVDTASYADAGASVVVNLASGAGSSGDAAGDILIEIENLLGSAFNDTLQGDDNNNRIEGGAGDDVLWGNDGNDILNGQGGRDTLFGGAGDDQFWFRSGDGLNVIIGLNPGDGTPDKIRLFGFGAAFDSFAEIMAAATQSNANTIVNLGGNILVLVDVVKSSLDPDDFIFG